MTVTVKGGQGKGTVSELLYGGNMEPTRRTFFSGITAQLFNNRKFFAVTDDGFAGWSCTGAVSQGEDLGKSPCHSYYPVLENGVICQQSDELTACKGTEYAFCFWAEAQEDATVTATWGDAWQCVFSLPASAEPQELSAQLVAAADGKQVFSLKVEGKAAVYCVSLMPADHVCGMRRDVLDTLKACGIRALRFPGGCHAEVYPWKEGLLPADRRPPIDSRMYNGTFLFRNTYGQDCHEIGIDEYIQLCRYIGAEPTITVPIVNKGVQEAVDWVEYCNGDAKTAYGALRAQRGMAEPYGVKHWFIGNEIYLFGGEIASDGKAAGLREKEFILAMKQVDPGIKAIVGFCPDAEEWSRASLCACADVADMLSHHFYLTCEFDSNFGKLSVEEALDVERSFGGSVIKAAEAARRLTGVPWDISVDEWSYDWGNRGHTVSALVDAIMFHFMLNHAEEYRIRQAFYFHPVNEGVVKVEPDGVETDVTGEIWKLFKAHSGNTVCETACDSDLVSVAATRNGEYTVITVINRDVRNPQTVTFDVPAQPVEWVELVPERVSTENNCFAVGDREITTHTVTLAPASVSKLVFKNEAVAE